MPRASIPTSGHREAIVVDDSRAMRAFMRAGLEACAFEVLEAADGEEALALLSVIRVPDVALIDWNMPNLNGLDLVRRLRNDARFSRMAIIMVTSETATDRVERALAAGADEYLMKPFSAELLIGKLTMLEDEEQECEE
jgi:two-component system, chemotaxis family, chemotaxis protein CheY